MEDLQEEKTQKKEKGRNTLGKFYNLLANFLTVGNCL